MTEQLPPQHSEDSPHSFDEQIALLDRTHEITEYDPEQTLKQFYVKRTNGAVEPWLAIGEGPTRLKLIKRENGKTLYKYLDRQKVLEQQAELGVEFAAERARTVVDLGREGTEAVPVIVDTSDLDSPEQQQDPYDYLRSALPPVTRPKSSEQENFYDSLLAGQSQNWQGGGAQKPETAEDRQRAYYDKFVTAENRQAAQTFLAESEKATPQIKEILSRAGIDPTSLEAIDAIRENPDIRFEVAKVLVQKLDRLAADPYTDMGDRVVMNSPNNLKEDPVLYGGKMMSRVYAVRMALKMIGGEFSSRLEGKSDHQRDERGKVILGQHRHAAITTLMNQ